MTCFFWSERNVKWGQDKISTVMDTYLQTLDESKLYNTSLNLYCDNYTGSNRVIISIIFHFLQHVARTRNTQNIFVAWIYCDACGLCSQNSSIFYSKSISMYSSALVLNDFKRKKKSLILHFILTKHSTIKDWEIFPLFSCQLN